ncbi:MAG TPA: CheR family methyltransferase [Flavisolibacter sp.]
MKELYGRTQAENVFQVAGIGAAGGGPEAMAELLTHLPANTGIAYIYVQHEETSTDTGLAALLAAKTSMPVIELSEEVTVEPDRLYVVPPGQHWVLEDGRLQLVPHSREENAMPLNMLFLSLAESCQEASIGLLLSGSGTDGTIGMKAIKASGGLTFVQDDSARFQGMPKSAAAEGAADMILSPGEMAAELKKIGRQKDAYFSVIRELDGQSIADNDEDLRGILHLLHRSLGVDFSQYKMNTIKRRIIRRMMLYNLDTLRDYALYVRQHANEVRLLYQDLLINVTQFFRDPESSEYLEKILLPRIIKGKSSSDPIRVWVPACSTGQEAYSLAMLIVEALGEKSVKTPIQVFATDLSETAITKARLGIYTREEVTGVSPRRLERFFIKIDGSYRVVKSIRDLCVFANHNSVKDPPFSRLDIISCCNLLIYLDSPLQRKLMSTFHYSLNNNGFLVLGKSETIGTSDYLFTQVDKKLKIYSRKKEATSKAMFEMSYRLPSEYQDHTLASGRETMTRKIKPERVDLEKAVDDLLLKKYTPASVVVNYDLDILQFRGSTGLFLQPAPGRASLNLMKMAHPSLGFELRNIVHKAKITGQPARKTGLEITLEGKTHRVAIEAVPVRADPEEDFFMVLFEEMPVPQEDGNPDVAKDRRVQQLEAELGALREDMRSIVEAQEAANEELQAANEEIVSSNEELQSINEELETSKEEIESSNEELITINQELQVRNDQLAEVQEYSEAVFSIIRESLLIMDRELRIKAANTAFFQTFRMKAQEVEGRYLSELGNGQWNTLRLHEMLKEIIHTNTRFQNVELTADFPGVGEKVLLMNACCVDQKTHGYQLVLLAIEDITEFRMGQKIVGEREAWFRNMADNAPVMIWVTGLDRLCNFTNKTFLEFRGMKPEDATGKTWFEGAHPDDLERCNKIYRQSFDTRQPFELKYRERHHDGSYRQLFTRAKPNFTTEGEFTGFIGSCVEIVE